MDVDAGRSEHSLPSPLQLKKLLKVYSQKLRQDPDDLDLRIKLAEVLRLLGRANEAIAFYSSIAWAYGIAGNLGQAITLCKIILELNPNHSETQQMLAKLYASQRIREEKQSVPVVQVEGRWVADPKGDASSARALGPSQPYHAPAMSHIDVEDDQIEDEASVHDDDAGRPGAPFSSYVDEEDDFEDEELTSDERPPRTPPGVEPREEGDPAAAGSRRSAPTSYELPPHRSEIKSLADELEPEAAETDDGQAQREPGAPRNAPTAPQTPTAAKRQSSGGAQNRATAPQPLVPEPSLPEPAGNADDWLAVAPTKRASPEEIRPPADAGPVVVTTDASGKLTIDPAAVARQPPDKRTLKVSAAQTAQLREAYAAAQAAEEESSTPAGGGTSKKLSKPTAPMPLAAQRRRIAESIAETPAPILPNRAAAPPPELPRIEDGGLEDEEPTRLDEPSAVVPTPGEVQLTPEQSAETVIGEPLPAKPAGAAAAPAVVDEEPTSLDEGVVDEEPTAVDDTAGAVEEPPPSPAGPGERAAKGKVATKRLSTLEMMGRLTAMGAPRDTRPVPQVTRAAPPPDEAPGAAEQRGPGEAEPIKKRGTAPGFQSTGELDTSAIHDPLRFLRTTRRYASVEIPPDERGDDATEVHTLDPSLVSSVMRMDAATNQPEPRRSSKGYAAIQREVQQDGRQQEDRGDLGTAEVEAAVEDLRDTIRELPGEVDPLDPAGPRARTPFPLFSDLDTPAFLAMVEKLERREHEAGSLVFQEGDPGDSLFLVSAGTLQVLKLDEEERQIELAKLGAGSFFGEFGLLTDRRRHASVRALDDCELLVLRREVLTDLVQQHPSISWTLRIFYQQRLMAMVLATSPLFQAVGSADRREVLSRFTIRRILEGETIIEEGKPTNGFYVILVGEVSVSCVDPDGLEVPLGTLSEGDYFGEISLLTGSLPEATVKANQLTEVLTLNARDFYDLTTTHPEIWAEVQRKADVRQQETAARLARRHKAEGPIPLI